MSIGDLYAVRSKGSRLGFFKNLMKALEKYPIHRPCVCSTCSKAVEHLFTIFILTLLNFAISTIREHLNISRTSLISPGVIQLSSSFKYYS